MIISSAERWKPNDVDADELRGLREQRAGDAGDAGADRVHGDELAPHRRADRRHPPLALADALAGSSPNGERTSVRTKLKTRKSTARL